MERRLLHRLPIAAVAVVVVLGAGACGHSWSSRPAVGLEGPDGAAQRLEPSDLEYYAYPRRPIEPLLERRLVRDADLYRVWHLELPSIGDNGQPGNRLRARYFESTRPGLKRLVIVLPVFGKSAYPSRKMARYLTGARDGGATNVLLLLGSEGLYDWRRLAASRAPDELVEEIGVTMERMRVTVIDVRRLVDWAHEQPDVDPARIGVVGFSFSSILANLAMAVDERIAAGVFFMGGGRIHQLFAYCQGNDVARAREVLARRFGWSDDEFERLLEAPLRPIDPVRFSSRLHDRPVLVADSALDRVVPPVSRVALRESLAEPERIRFLVGHRTAFLSLTPLGFNHSARKIRRFVTRAL